MQIAVATPLQVAWASSLVELMIAMMVIAIALVAMMVTLLEGQRFATEAHENTLALNAARSALEQMRQTQFDQIFSTFRAGQPLSTFTVPGLNPISGQPTVGRIRMPEAAGELCEDTTLLIDPVTGLNDSVLFGMGISTSTALHDLNGNATFNEANVSATYSILPVRIVLDWRGVRGNVHYEFTDYLVP